MNRILDNVNKQSERWQRNQKKGESYKNGGIAKYDAFAHGYATGWVKALQAFKGWLTEFSDGNIPEEIKAEIYRCKALLERPYAYVGGDEKKCKDEAYNEILSFIEILEKEK